MVLFADTTTVIRGGSCKTNRDSQETNWKAQKEGPIVGKKRPPSTPHPSGFEGTTKKRSPGNDGVNDDDHVDAQIRMRIASQDIDSPNSMVQANAVGALIEYGNEAGANVANISGKNKGSEQEGKRSHDSSDDSNKDADKERLEPEEGLQMISEEGNGNDENNDQSKRWMEFVDVVETKAIPNLEAYSNAKAIRTETSIRFVNSIDACIQTLHDTIDGVISDVVEPICNQYSEGFNDTEDNIITTMVSNHSRRNKLLELMHNADAAWSNKYNKLTSEIMGDNQTDQKSKRDKDITEEVGKEKGSYQNGNIAATGDGEGRNRSKGLVAANFSSVGTKEKTIFGHEDSDWEELLEYEPSHDRILSFLDERVKRIRTMRIFGESLHDVHSGLESEVEAILHLASDLYNQHETACIDSEDEIEYFVMENYQRRGNLQKELEKSAQHAQGLFANLLNRLSQSVS